MNEKGCILVTGGLGYIGSHTVVALQERGYEVVIVDNLANSRTDVLRLIKRLTGTEPQFYQADCTNREEMARVFDDVFTIDGIIHFAAHKAVGESVTHPLKYYRNNMDGLLTLLEFAQAFGIQNFVFSSSATVYGAPTALPVTEQTPLAEPASPYGATKLFAEQILQSVANAYKEFRCLALRYFNPIGAHPSGFLGEFPQGVPNNLLPYITQTVSGVLRELTIYGSDYPTPDGTPLRDYFHVCDLARAHVLALEYLERTEDNVGLQFVNIGAGRGVSVLEIVETFERVTGKHVPYRIGARRQGDVPEVWADIKKAWRLLGWKPEFTLEDALRDAWKWEQTIRR